MRAQHNRRRLRGRNSNHLKIPSHVTKRIRNVTDNLSWEALRSIRIREGESDAVHRVGDDGPIAPIPAIGTTVQGVCSLWCFWSGILVGSYVRGYAIDGESAVLDAVCVAAWDTAEMGVLFVLVVVNFPSFLSSISRHLFSMNGQLAPRRKSQARMKVNSQFRNRTHYRNLPQYLSQCHAYR